MTTWLATSAREFMSSESRARQPLETGGVLLGWRRGDTAVVAAALGPGPGALHGRYLFIPDDRWHTEQIKALFSGSGGDLNYLGDWHSHPNGIAMMSSQDDRTLKRIARRVGTGTMIILAGELVDDAPIACWSGVRTGGFLGLGCEIVTDELRMFNHPGEQWPKWSNPSAAD